MKEKNVDVAIVGMSCRFPGARNYTEYWGNLINNINNVSEIPADRWDWRDYYGNPESKANKTNIKWGGFINEIDKFDPLFFKISPREANYIDPQHRLVLESTWHAIEDAGYDPRSLAGRKIGVYVGVSKNDYAELMRENKESIISFVSTGTVHSIIANRVSYLLDFTGKSEVVDTACSSFMVALNNAVKDIQLGTCESAVVAGVNAILTPTMYISHSKSGMLSNDGICRSFDEKADGYVRGEGVGVVYLKPLAQAQQDGDDIWGVIKGIAVAHGGKSNFLTAPKASSQATVIREAIKNAHVAPYSISYIEAHGTGTSLGDPIEIEALKDAYSEAGTNNHCAISSVKTNMGHLESAAGVAGLIKILLAFKHKMIPGLLNFNKLNPYIKLKDSPFYIAEQNIVWGNSSNNETELPLRAGLSAFGMGGVNAHAIFEAAPTVKRSVKNKIEKVLIPISAKTDDQLKEYVKSVLEHVKLNQAVDLNSLAYTLAFGREAMECRIAFITDENSALQVTIQDFLDGKINPCIINGSGTYEAGSELEKNAYAWVSGESKGWEDVVDNAKNYRMHLPVYPFKKMRCWFSSVSKKNNVGDTASKKKELAELERSSNKNVFKISDYFIRDHVVKDENVVPGVKYLDLILTEAENRANSEVNEISDVFWMKPIKVLNEIVSEIEFVECGKNMAELSVSVENSVYCTGKVKFDKRKSITKRVDIDKIKKRCDQKASATFIYETFKKSGLDYGDTFRVIQSCQFNKNEIICDSERYSGLSGDAVIEPSIADGVFQTVAALYLLSDEYQNKQLLPYYLKNIRIYDAMPEKCLVYAKRNVGSGEKTSESYNMYLCRDSGEIIAEFDEFVKRAYEKDKETEDNAMQLLTYAPTWIKRELGMHRENLSTVLVFNNEKNFVDKIKDEYDDSHVIEIKSGKTFKKINSSAYIINSKNVDSYHELWASLKADTIAVEGVIYAWNLLEPNSVKNAIDLGVKAVLNIIKTLILSKNVNKIRILYLYYNHASIYRPLHSMIGGFSRTLVYENPNVTLESVGIDTTDKVMMAEIACRELSFYNNAPLYEIRYESNIRKVKAIVSSLQENNGEIIIKKYGSYLITGGCGGLGFIFAKYLAREYQANLVLVGRSKLSTLHEEKLKELSVLGGESYYVQADIGNNKSTEKLSALLQEKNIALDGVIHCAGMIDDAFIINKTSESFDKVISAKVQGTINLDKLTKDETLDFFMVFSSIASIMPNQGQCDYAAANSFLDEFVNYRALLTQENERSGKSITINWPLWKNGGIGVIKEEEEHLKDVFGMLPLETDLGIEIFVDTVKENNGKLVEQVIPIDGDKNKIEKHLQVFDRLEEPKISSIDSQLKNLVRNVLDRSKSINNEESLSDLGLGSIGLVKLTKAINEEFSLNLEPTILFEHNSISKLSHCLQNEHLNQIQKQCSSQQKNNFTPERSLLDLERSQPASLEFVKGFSQQEYFMRDHIVDGKYNVPGACYIEMAIEGGNEIPEGKTVYKLTNNYWAKQLSTTGEVVDAQLKFNDKGEFYEYEISSLLNNENILHAVGQLYTMDDNDELDLGYIDFENLRSKCHTKREPEEIYQFIHSEGLHVGPSFMPMLNIVLSDKEAFSHLMLPDFVSKTSLDYIFHPSLLTGVLQTALLNNKPEGMDDTQLIPIAIDEIIFTNKIPGECYVHTQVRELSGSNNEIVKFDARIADPEGKVIASIKGLTLRNLTSMKSIISATSKKEKVITKGFLVDGDFSIQVETLLKESLCEFIGLPTSEIESNVDLGSYGINSVMIVDLNRALGEIFGSLSKTLFFEYKSIRDLAEYFIENHKNILTKMFSNSKQTVSESDIQDKVSQDKSEDDTQEIFVYDSNKSENFSENEDLAIIGVGGRYPQAESLLEFWDNLKKGKDCITDMPKWRFNYDKFYQETNDDSLLSARWGGFVDDIDKFDPQLFNISPKQAELLDPQERLFLEIAWETIENAGYDQESLHGRSIGVFVGALWQPYTALGIEQTVKGNPQMPDGLLYNIPNRVSFFFDWSGPSLTIDTACSSSLSALHFACKSVKQGDCEAALVGGVNLSFTSDKYLWLTKNNFLSSEGKCSSFGVDGDGYVPGEGVGAVYIKKLSDAIKDEDNILGVIKATSVNHGGRTNGYTVPNPNRQADLIASSINKSNVSVDKINYIEAHVTGTSLGDPIEITGITKAFSKHKDKDYRCTIGSVKSNIGHLEAAAGIVGLTKILLQMKYKMLVPSLHAEVLNPNIDFENSFLEVQKELVPWERVNSTSGELEPYCAMLSSFGAGGSNAHAIIEEYRVDSAVGKSNIEEYPENFILPISAANKERLQVYVRKILNHLENHIDEEVRCKSYDNELSYLRDYVYTFQMARHQMNERLVIAAKNLDELKTKLEQYLCSPEKIVEGIYSANVKDEKNAFKLLSSDVRLNQVFDDWVTNGNSTKIAGLWIGGVNINWKLLYGSMQVKRIDIPTYPFKKESYWLKQVAPIEPERSINEQEKLHPLLHKNTSDFFEQRYSSTFKPGYPFLIKLNNSEKYVLPNLTSIEMLQEAIFQATNNRKNLWKIKNISWNSPVLIYKNAKELHASLNIIKDDGENVNEMSFEQYSTSENDGGDKLVHGAGTISLIKNYVQEKLNISKLQQEIDQDIYETEGYYQYLDSYGIAYSREYCTVSTLRLKNNRALAKMTLQENDRKSSKFTIHPGLVTSIVEIVKSLMAREHPEYSDLTFEKVFVKALDEISIFKKCNNIVYCFIDRVNKTESVKEGTTQYNICLCDKDGNVSVKLQNISLDVSAIPQSIEKSVSSNINNKITTIRETSLANFVGQEKVNNAVNESQLCSYRCSKTIQETIDVQDESVVDYSSIQSFLIESLASSLGLSVSEVEIDKPFVDMGMNFFSAIEWVDEINENYGCAISEKIVSNHSHLTDFAHYVFSIITAEDSINIVHEEETKDAELPKDNDSKIAINEKLDAKVSSIDSHDAIKDFLVKNLASSLGCSVYDVEIDKSFVDMGMDSISAVEWIDEINENYGCNISETRIYDYPNVAEFANYIDSEINAGKHISELQEKNSIGVLNVGDIEMKLEQTHG